MAFNVDFYVFSKKTNSTNRPTATPTTHACVLKTESSIASPVLLLNLGLQIAPNWNYCYIAAYNRYYFINNWTWTDDRLWQADLVTDLLATFKDQIGAAQLYVLRSSYTYDGYVPDEYYPSKANSQFQVLQQATPFTFNAQSGSYVIGISSGLHPTYGTNTYYLMDSSQLDALMQALNTEIVTQVHLFNEADASYALQKALIDPFQFVTSCTWFPLSNADMPGIGGQATVTAGGFPLDSATGQKINASTPIVEYSLAFTLPDHPQIARGQYLNASHRKLFLEIPPFGTAELDGTIACRYSKIIVKMGLDVISGMATIRIGCGDGTDITELLERYEARVGVPIQLNNIQSDLLGVAGGAVRGLGGMAMGVFMGSVSGTLTSMASGIGDIVRSAKPRAVSMGSTGSYASLVNTVPQGTPTSYVVQAKLYVQFLILVDEDNDHSGRPLCQLQTIGNIPGFIMVKDGELDLPAFAGEEQEVRAFLEGGFFYG